MRWDNVKSIVLKEYWTYVGNRKIIFSTLTVIVLYAIIIGINYITGPKALTSYSRAIAIKQISSSPPTVFGIGPLDVKKMGDNAILLAAMVVQLPPPRLLCFHILQHTHLFWHLFLWSVHWERWRCCSPPPPRGWGGNPWGGKNHSLREHGDNYVDGPVFNKYPGNRSPDFEESGQDVGTHAGLHYTVRPISTIDRSSGNSHRPLN